MSANSTVNLDGRGSSDADGDPITFRWEITLHPANSTAVLTGATFGDSFVLCRSGGTYTINLTVTDSLGIANSHSVNISAVVDNRAPEIRSVPVTAASAGHLYSYAVQAFDPDAGDTLTFSLPAAPAGMTIIH